MADVKYDLVQRVEMGFGVNAAQHTNIENIVSFGDRLEARDGKHVDPINVVNIHIPQGIHQNHKYYIMTLVVDTHNHEAFYAQPVQAAAPGSRAIREGADNDFVEYFRAFIRESDGTQTSYSYEADKVWCIGEEHRLSNERGERHQGTCTYTFICLGSRSVVGW